MMSLKQSQIRINGSDVFRQKNPVIHRRFSVLPPLSGKSCVVSASKSNISYVGSSIDCFGSIKRKFQDDEKISSLITCKAYEANKPIDGKTETSIEAARKVKIGVYFATWWALNVVFNIYNKKVLNAFPFPWLTSTLSLAAGSLIMLVSWALRVAEAPKTDMEFWKTLFPVSKIRVFCDLGFVFLLFL